MAVATSSLEEAMGTMKKTGRVMEPSPTSFRLRGGSESGLPQAAIPVRERAPGCRVRPPRAFGVRVPARSPSCATEVGAAVAGPPSSAWPDQMLDMAIGTGGP